MSSKQPLRHIRNTLVIVFVSVMAIDALPSCHLAHSEARSILDPLLDKSGLWQGPWNLFAPDVDKTNTCVAAEFTTSSGRTYQWRSPDPAKMNPWSKFWNFRWLEYYDSIRNNANKAAWPDLVAWLKRQPDVIPAAEEVISVKVFRSWSHVDVDTLGNADKYPYRERFQFYEEDRGDAE